MNPLDAAAVARATAEEPAWRSEIRSTAHGYFENSAAPNSAEELWRYVDLDFTLDDFAIVDEPGTAPPPSISGIEADRKMSIVDGLTVGGDVGATDGVWLGSMRAAPEALDSVLQEAASRGVRNDLDKFAAAHGAFAVDGAVVHVAQGRHTEVLLVDVAAATSGAVSFPRIVVVAENAATASVVVHLHSGREVDALVVPRFEVVCGDGANVKLSIVQDLGRASRSIGHLRAGVGRDSNLVLAEAGLGGLLSRLHLAVDLEGRGASANVVGAYFGDQRQVLDYRYFMHHAGLDTRSDMFLKGAVEDEALSVFTGMIRIDESAQRTDAFQTNRNLILSEGAAAQSVPNLEILANDVRCGHGSTVGPLDAEQRYYLMSRGLDRERADRLQVRGFFQEALDRFPHPEVSGPVATAINAKFVEAQEEGRV